MIADRRHVEVCPVLVLLLVPTHSLLPNSARRAAKEALEKEQNNQNSLPAPAKPRVKVKSFIKIGRPGYKVTKQKDTKSDQHSLLFQVDPGTRVDQVSEIMKAKESTSQRNLYRISLSFL